MKNLLKIQQSILNWWDQNGRKALPWHHTRSPYEIWVSEVMLQQTQVKTVIPYFERFMERLPNLKALALCDLNTVLHLWTGLGYYNRARNLHKSAGILLKNFGGNFPKTVEEWESLPGIGRSTAGAIVAASFDIKAPILDGNVKRVLCRLSGVEGWPGQPKITQHLWSLANQWTPNHDAAQWTQAVMDLGALVCKRPPDCSNCPINQYCSAHKSGRTHTIPAPRPKKTRPTKMLHFFIVYNGASVWLEQRSTKGIWASLWTPPMEETHEAPSTIVIQGHSLSITHSLPIFTHELSHFHLVIHPHILEANRHQMSSFTNGIWYAADLDIQVGLPTPVKKLIHQTEGVLAKCE